MAVERPKPIVEQVNEVLRQRIRDKTYAHGERLPSESDFASEFGVSRATIRTVLARLEVAGLIIRKQGDGTYINERLQDVTTHLGGLWEFTQLIESSGYQASIQTLLTEIRASSADEAATLGIEAGDRVLALKRLFLADQKPVIIAHNVLPENLLVDSSTAIDGTKAIRSFVKSYCQREIAYAISDIHATQVDQEIAAILSRKTGDSLLKLSITFYDKNNLPLLSGMSYFDDAALKLRLVQAWG